MLFINSFSGRLNSNMRKCFESTTATNVEASILGPPPPSGAQRQYPEKIQKIVNEISKLTLIEVSELNELLKVYVYPHLLMLYIL